MFLDLKPEVENLLLANARATGTTASEYITCLLQENTTVQHDTVSPLANGRKRTSAFGKYAFVKGGSEEFAKQKQVEIDLEDRPRS